MDNSKKDSTKNSKETIQQILSDEIERRGLRKTPERFTILEEIYQTEGHFTVDSLYNQLNEKNYHLSRATIYNTVEFLYECHLVLKHYFHKEAEYEKCFNCKVHHHLVCTKCGTVKEFTDSNIRRDVQTRHYKKFNMTHFSLVVYGLCEKCQNSHQV